MTPTTWATVVRGGRIKVYDVNTGKPICWLGGSGPKSIRKARLIAAAPKLFAALKDARQSLFRAGEAMNTPMFTELSAIDEVLIEAGKLPY